MSTIEVQVHLISVQELSKKDQICDTAYGVAISGKDGIGMGQHLYFTNSEEIGINDWCMYIDEGSKDIRQVKFIKNGDLWFSNDTFSKRHNVAKIVATTNPELWIVMGDHPYYSNTKRQCGDQTKSISKIPQSFISSYIKRYNEGNKIDKVLIETTEYIHKMCEESPFPALHIKTLKLTENGEVIVVPKEEKKDEKLDKLEKAIRFLAKEMHYSIVINTILE
jgi:hypothetical protein